MPEKGKGPAILMRLRVMTLLRMPTVAKGRSVWQGLKKNYRVEK
jgi:hypothetical protein